MSKIGLDTKEYLQVFRAVMLPEFVKSIKNNFPDVDLTDIPTEAIQTVFRAATISALEDYFTFALERIIDDNNKKIYEDLVKFGVIKEEVLEEKEEVKKEVKKEVKDKKKKTVKEEVKKEVKDKKKKTVKKEVKKEVKDKKES